MTRRPKFRSRNCCLNLWEMEWGGSKSRKEVEVSSEPPQDGLVFFSHLACYSISRTHVLFLHRFFAFSHHIFFVCCCFSRVPSLSLTPPPSLSASIISVGVIVDRAPSASFISWSCSVRASLGLQFGERLTPWLLAGCSAYLSLVCFSNTLYCCW